MAKNAVYQRTFDANGLRSIKRSSAREIVKAIWAEHNRRLSSQYLDQMEKIYGYSLTKNETAKNFLRREIYALGRCLIRIPPKWDVREIAGEIRRNTTRPETLSRTFHALLMSVYEADSIISRQERSLMAQELEYAHRHDVPPELLCGFLYQSGPRNEIRKKLASSSYLEPAYAAAGS